MAGYHFRRDSRHPSISCHGNGGRKHTANDEMKQVNWRVVTHLVQREGACIPLGRGIIHIKKNQNTLYSNNNSLLGLTREKRAFLIVIVFVKIRN